MSGIFGIYRPSGNPVEPRDLKQMANSTRHRGPDGTETFIKSNVALGHSMLATTPEAEHEIQPFQDPPSGMTITADARIDNRNELIDRLGLEDSITLSDSQIILKSYQRWGTECCKELLGDFAFSIWDPLKQQLFCARDYIGVKPFHYYHSRNGVLFASEIKALLEQSEVETIINESMVAEYLTFSFLSRTETLYRKINRLAPGHYLIVDCHNQVKITRYWFYGPCKRICYKNISDYTEHFLMLFEEAVGARIRCNTAISAELSGGLDSSMVVGMANLLLKKEGVVGPETYGMVFPGLACDESKYIDAVAEMYNLKVRRIQSHQYQQPDWEGQMAFSYLPPEIPNITMRDKMIQSVGKRGYRAMLSGIGGDDWFTGSGNSHLDLLLKGKLRQFLEHFKYQLRVNKKHAIKQLAINMCWPLLHPRLRESLCRCRLSPPPGWVSHEFLNRVGFYEKKSKYDPRHKLSNLGKTFSLSPFIKGSFPYFLETMDRYHALVGVEYRSPFLDRRIAEYSLQIPDNACYWQGQIKYLFRSEKNILLPEAIRERQDKAEFSYFFQQAIAQPVFKEVVSKYVLKKSSWTDSCMEDKLVARLRNTNPPFQLEKGENWWQIWFYLAIADWQDFLNR